MKLCNTNKKFVHLSDENEQIDEEEEEEEEEEEVSEEEEEENYIEAGGITFAIASFAKG